MYSKQFVILAKSYKQGGWCIAGREISLDRQKNSYQAFDPWIRPVSDDVHHHGALQDAHCTYEDGSAPKIYDLAEVDFLESQDEPGQPENELIAPKRWRKLGAIDPAGMNGFVEEPDDVWNENTSVDYVTDSYEKQGGIDSSLMIIKPVQFRVHLSNNLNTFTNEYKREIRASFLYQGMQYSHFSITDPVVRKILGRQYPEEGDDEVVTTLNKGDDYYLCLSLGPQFTKYNRHYKLVATVFDYDGYLQRNYS